MITKTKYENVYIDEIGNVYYKKDNQYYKYCQWKDNVGYLQFAFVRDGKKKWVRVHRLMAETFLENLNNYKYVNHIDGNKLNNHLTNLEWTTNSKNTQQGYNQDMYHSKKRSHAVIAIHKTTKRVYEFPSIRQCAENLQLNRKTITAILKKEKANNYDYDFEYKEL